MRTLYFNLFCGLAFCVFQSAFAQEDSQTRLLTEFSPFLSKAYFNVNLGGIYYPFKEEYLNQGFNSTGTTLNSFSGRILLGYKFKETWALQFGVMRPAIWFTYNDIEYDGQKSSVLINLWSLSVKKNIKLYKDIDLFGEVGVGNLTRIGIYNKFTETSIYDDTHYITPVFGLGLQYKLSKKWDILWSSLYLPEYESKKQPYTFQMTLGATYNLRQIEKEKAVKYAEDENYFFPKRFLQIGFGSGQLGFFTNEFFSAQAEIGSEELGLPVFWLGDVKARSTYSAMYQQTVFRSRRYFSFDVGTSFTYFESYEGSSVFALSVFPVIRFYLWRPKPFDFYINYSVIGPAYISKEDIDNVNTGPSITYQDFMGIGLFFGKKRQYNFDLKIMHYSNGNIFTRNDGVAIPLIFSFGKTL